MGPKSLMDYATRMKKDGWSIDPRDIQPESWWTNDVARDRVLLEMKRIADYTLKGDITLG